FSAYHFNLTYPGEKMHAIELLREEYTWQDFMFRIEPGRSIEIYLPENKDIKIDSDENKAEYLSRQNKVKYSMNGCIIFTNQQKNIFYRQKIKQRGEMLISD